MFGFGGLKACLPRRWRKINVNFRRRHGVRCAKLWCRLIQRRKGFRILILITGNCLLSVGVIHVVVQTERARLEVWERLLLRYQAGRGARARARTDARITVVQSELIELHNRILE